MFTAVFWYLLIRPSVYRQLTTINRLPSTIYHLPSLIICHLQRYLSAHAKFHLFHLFHLDCRNQNQYPGSNPELVAAVSAAGGMGIVQPLSLTHLYGHDFREGLRMIKKLSNDQPFGVNFTIVPDKKYKVLLPHSTLIPKINNSYSYSSNSSIL